MVNNGCRNKLDLEKTCILIAFYVIIYAKGNENHSMIHILTWTKEVSPFPYWDMGQQCFIKKNCQYQNCVVTNNKSYFPDVRSFDAIMFNALNFKDTLPPLKRSVKQKYVFVSVDPPAYFSVPSRYNGFFNLTYTYKLDSDVTLRFLIVRNDRGKIIGPKKDMYWIDIKDMKPASDEIKKKLKNKKKAAAWFVSNCYTPGQREDYVQKLSIELSKYDLNIDVFGACGHLECLRFTKTCYDILESDYYFYLSFENAMCEDYVTEKLLTALKHFTVPVVYGGANYTRFMPKGIYLDANAFEPEELARTINDTIGNKEKYYNFFKWHGHYSYHDPTESADSDEVCAFCAFLNNEKHMYKSSVHKDMANFWFY